MIASAGILTVDRALVIQSWNGWLETATGVLEADAVGRPLDSFVPDFDTRGWRARFTQVLDAGTTQVLAAALHKHLIPCKPRTPSPQFPHMRQRVSLGPWREAAQGEILGVVVTIEDVTARVESERELASALADPVSARGVLGDPDWRARRDAVEQLSAAADRETLDSVVQAVQRDHRDMSVLSSALQLLSRSEADMTDRLGALLRDPDPDLRVQAALALGQQLRPSAAEPLIAALDDEDVNVRFHAIEALGLMRARAAVDRLLEIAQSGEFFLAFPAIDALTRIGDRAAAPPLVPLLADAALRTAVASALASLGDARAVAPLVRLLNDDAAAADAVVTALEAICRRDAEIFGGDASLADEAAAAITPAGIAHLVQGMREAQATERQAYLRVAGWIDTAATDEAVLTCLGDPQTGRDAVEMLARRGARVVPALIDALQSESADRRRGAVVALGRIGDARATGPLLALADTDHMLLVPITAALARIGDARAFEPLLALLEAPSAAVRQGAIGALNSMGHPDLERRIGALLSHADPIARESAVRVAGYFGFRTCADAILERASDPHAAVRKAAIEHLPFLEDPRVPAILEAALRDEAAPVRAAAAQAIGRTDGDLAPLYRALEDADQWVRYYGARALGARGAKDATGSLTRVALSDPATPVRIAAIEALPDTGDPDAIMKAVTLAADDDPEVAAAFVAAAGRTGDPRSLPVLEEAIRDSREGVRLAAIEGLRALGGARAIDVLQWTAGAGAGTEVGANAVEALAALAPSHSAAMRSLVALLAEPALHPAVITALGEAGAGSIDEVAGALDHSSRDVRLGAVAALARLRDTRATERLLGALGDEEAAVRETAVVALMRLGTGTARGALARLADADPARTVRAAAAEALAVLDRADR